MYRGTVWFTAGIKGVDKVRFRPFPYDPQLPGIDKIELEGPDGVSINSSVLFSAVSTPDEGLKLAEKANCDAIDRLSFCHDLMIRPSRRSGETIEEMIPPSQGVRIVSAGISTNFTVGGVLRVEHELQPDTLKAALEQPRSPGQRYYGLYRSSLLSDSPPERFMHLYHILLMLHDDEQKDVDAFIVAEAPGVPQSPQPPNPKHKNPKPGRLETVYTRLRNEFAHKRPNADLEDTKEEMTRRLWDLQALTKRAIELAP